MTNLEIYQHPNTAITSNLSTDNKKNNRISDVATDRVASPQPTNEQQATKTGSTAAITTTSSCSVFTQPCIETCTIPDSERQTVLLQQPLVLTKSKDDNETTTTTKPCALAEQCVSSCAAYGRVCPCAARIAAHAACKGIRDLMTDSTVFTNDSSAAGAATASVVCTGPPADFPFVDSKDVIIRDKLGEGGFSAVCACSIIRRRRRSDYQPTQQQEHQQPTDDNNNNNLVDEEELYDEVMENDYAIKYLKKRCMVDLHQFKHGAADLAVEAFVLHRLSHPNIVRLHGVTAGSIESVVAAGTECGYFIIIDRLYGTLETKISQWQKEEYQLEHANGGLIHRLFTNEYKNGKKHTLNDRLRIALSISHAMEYIHSLNLVYRDLKPDNVGFTKDGIVKLFDFGLTKELKPSSKCSDTNNYRLTGNTGSRRYMSPEVAEDKPYNQSVDVYSFGILLWEMCTLEKPFQGYSSCKHMNLVVLGHERPKLDSHYTQYWPPNLVWLVKNCWSHHPVSRPSFTMIIQVLNDILNDRFTVPKSVLAIEKSTTSSSSSSLLSKSNHSQTRSPVSVKQITEAATDLDIKKDSPSLFLSPLSRQHNRRTASETISTASTTSPSNPGKLAPPNLSLSPLTPGKIPKPPKMTSGKNGGANGTGRARTWGFALKK